MPALAGGPYVARSPAGRSSYAVFDGARRVARIRPDGRRPPRVEGVGPLEQQRYRVEPSPFAPGRYDVLRDGKRIGSVREAPPPSGTRAGQPAPSGPTGKAPNFAERLRLPSGGFGTDAR
jgi:hypothetical protein